MSNDILTDRWTRLTAEDVMKTDLITVSYATPLSEIERVLSENRISGVPVTDQIGRVVGVVSIRDLLDRYVEDSDARPRRGPGYFHLSSEQMDEDFDSFDVPAEAEETAENIMNAEVYTVAASDTVRQIAQSMVKHQIHRVLVTEPETGAVVGLISSMGILAAVSA